MLTATLTLSTRPTGVAAGASYGGCRINWIQGNDRGRTFKALVSHDGTVVADAEISTEELWSMQHDVRDPS